MLWSLEFKYRKIFHSLNCNDVLEELYQIIEFAVAISWKNAKIRKNIPNCPIKNCVKMKQKNFKIKLQLISDCEEKSYARGRVENEKSQGLREHP